ncbi:hypothetical protein GE253_09945 [Niveispirillum sp. SYP-B3756]|uniref:hypothetical protein n=1 Tax=Niveispirillum sp. SYP-B3756 TaxID=2662178 RepID=UPI001290E8B3|nr:hypothetical protein [Niveispirillum sp. SYP-B3756]MQP65661.1 hypothetical protein [Niveispirillum sp. SYP-B3756]
MNITKWIIAAGLMLCITSGAQAKDCRITDSVTASVKSLADNKNMGGHVSIHIVGQPTEVGKSRFATWKQFTDLFSKWKTVNDGKKPAPADCGGAGGSKSECVPIDRLGGWQGTKASICTAVDANGACTASQNITVLAVNFGYYNSSQKVKDGGTAGKWIMNTAYPSANADCSG